MIKAFPVENRNVFNTETGMDLRDYFASAAMGSYFNAMLISYMNDKCKVEGIDFSNVSKVAYQIADSMMKEREK